MTLLDHRKTAATKKLDFKNSHLTSVGAIDGAAALGRRLSHKRNHFIITQYRANSNLMAQKSEASAAGRS
jgi:hypothetical protein